MTPQPHQVQAMAPVLDSLGIALCVYDDNDCAVSWNAQFLRFFPEHDGFIHVGEHYSDNLRRFYAGRLTRAELSSMEEYVQAGVMRHRMQTEPLTFQHRGQWLRVGSVPMAGVGRVRIWTTTAAPTAPGATPGNEGNGHALEAIHLFEHVADGIMVVDADGLISWVNDRFVVLYGLGGKMPAIGRRFEAVYATVWAGPAGEEPPRETGLARDRQTLREKMALVGVPFQLPLPGDRWVRVVAQRSSTGISYFAHVDITLLERRRRELTEKTLQLETTLSSMTQGILMVDAEGRLSVYNKCFLELLDLPEALLAGRPTLAELAQFQMRRGDFGEDARFVQPHARASVKASSLKQIPSHYLRTTAEGRVLEVKSQSLEGGGMVRTFTDVTDYVRVKEELQRLNDELEQRVSDRTAQLEAANKELEAFSYSIAHDLRQPLSSIDAFASLLAGLVTQGNPAPGGKAEHYAARMRAGIRQMSALTDGLLALAQLSRARLQWKEFDLGAEAQRVAAQLAERDREAGPARSVLVDVAPGLVVHGEPVLLRQVVENLIGNAWKFTARRPEACIRVGCAAQPDGSAAYFVRDNGAGFDMAYASKLFGAFQRLHSPTEFPGTGIGLATVQRIVARHGGRVWAEGVEGEGATFYFTLGRPGDAVSV